MMINIKNKLNQLLLALSFSVVVGEVYASPAWIVSIPESYIGTDGRFKYTGVLYLTEESFRSQEPLNFDCINGDCWIQVNTQVTGEPDNQRGGDGNGREPLRLNVRGAANVGEALRMYFEGIGRQYVYTFDSDAPDRRGEGITWCGAMGISPISGNGYNYVVMNGGACANLPPPDLSCNLETENLVLDHFELNYNELDGNQKTGTFSINCNQDATLVMSITSPDLITSTPPVGAPVGSQIKLKDDGSLISLLSVDNRDLTTPQAIQVAGGGVTFDVRSELKTISTSVPPGPFSSFAYVTISYQ